jgi:hypothetical protein
MNFSMKRLKKFDLTLFSFTNRNNKETLETIDIIENQFSFRKRIFKISSINDEEIFFICHNDEEIYRIYFTKGDKHITGDYRIKEDNLFTLLDFVKITNPEQKYKNEDDNKVHNDLIEKKIDEQKDELKDFFIEKNLDLKYLDNFKDKTISFDDIPLLSFDDIDKLIDETEQRLIIKRYIRDHKKIY